MLTRRKIAMIMAEFLGTGILALVFLAVANSSLGLPFFVALGGGLAIAAGVLTLGMVSGAHLNPAITIGMWSARRIKLLPAVVYIASQFLGAAAAYMLFTYFTNSGMDWQTKGDFEGRLLVTEAVGTFIFAMAWAAAVYHRMSDAKAAVVVGLGFLLGVVATSLTAMSTLNPAVALSQQVWGWNTVLGPILGAIIGFNLYGLLFAPESEIVDGDARPARTEKVARVEKTEKVETKPVKKKK